MAKPVMIMGRGKLANRLGRFVCVAKPRGSAMSDEIAEFRIGERGLEFPSA